ncbi:hypothetical protein [Leifsonia sp. P73]|uniref:hypothetical protein n=1 Tax=Leifsonia sp. P73 TaxID=3423959 RepID=UPI003DA63B9A
MDATKIRQLIATARSLADELEAELDGSVEPVIQPVRTDSALTTYDPLHNALPEKADVKGSRRQMDMALLVLFSTLYAVNRRQNRGLAGSELRDLAHSVRYSDLRSLVQWEKYAMKRDAGGFRWVTEEGHKWWIEKKSAELGYQLPDDLAIWVETKA